MDVCDLPSSGHLCVILGNSHAWRTSIRASWHGKCMFSFRCTDICSQTLVSQRLYPTGTLPLKSTNPQQKISWVRVKQSQESSLSLSQQIPEVHINLYSALLGHFIFFQHELGMSHFFTNICNILPISEWSGKVHFSKLEGKKKHMGQKLSPKETCW